MLFLSDLLELLIACSASFWNISMAYISIQGSRSHRNVNRIADRIKSFSTSEHTISQGAQERIAECKQTMPCGAGKYRTIVWFILSTLVFKISQSTLYPFGEEQGDNKIAFDSWDVGSREVVLLQSVPFFGNGRLQKLWVNTAGSVSYNALSDARLNVQSSNVILAPFFVLSQQGASGAIYMRQVQGNDELLRNLSRDVSRSSGQTNNDFSPTFALVLTWYRMASVQDSSLVNTFQIVLTSDGNRTYSIYNYGMLRWFTSPSGDATAGLFSFDDQLASCWFNLPGSETEKVLLLSRTTTVPGVPGRHVLDITDPLKCTSKFESPCGKFPQQDRGYYHPYFENTGSNHLGWQFYLRFSCKPNLHIAPGVSSSKVRCKYEPDYYEYTWETTTPRCIDLDATRQFRTQIGVIALNDPTLQWFNDVGAVTSELVEVVDATVTQLLERIEVTDVLSTVDEIRNETVGGSLTNVSSATNFSVVFTSFVPAYTNKRLNALTLKDKISNALNQDINSLTFDPNGVVVTDITDRCLQGCLCRVRFDPAKCKKGKRLPELQPDACCGACSGKPYASSIKACCNGKHIYDPTKAVCCTVGVRKGNKCPRT